MNDLLEQLNEQQKSAVEYNDGPSLIIAGAGSGKTRVLTYKIAHLMKNGHAPQSILALTFTNKAAREMKDRIAKLIGHQYARGLWMGTFHSVFSRILRVEADKLGYTSSFTIMDSSDSKNLIKSIIKEYQLDDKIYKPSKVASIISIAKNALISPKAYANDKEIIEADSRSKIPLIKNIYIDYNQRLKKSNAMDFDDLLYNINILFKNFPDVLEKYQNIFGYILVDEYQDTNFSQYLVINQLSQKNRKVCVVGDDAQSIYSFRGANISNILKFQETYNEAKLFKLEQNYRSTQNIVNIANGLIKQNTQQIPKNIFSQNGIGEKIDMVGAFSDLEEGAIVANKIIEIRNLKQSKFSEFAILYRTNAQSRIFEESLRKRNIPYRIWGGLSFYQRKEIKNIIAYFRMIINPHDEEAFKRIINFPTRGIGATTLKKISSSAINGDTSYWEVIKEPKKYNLDVNSGTLKKLDAFKSMISKFIEESKEKNAYELASDIIKEIGITKDAYLDKSPEAMSMQQNIQELLSGLNEFCNSRIEEGNNNVKIWDFLAEVSLLTDQDNEKDDEQEKVTLMTIHASKGLEFKNIFIVGVEEDLFPSALARISPMEIEEERRLFYVAITRAEEYCMISYAKNRYKHGQSNFCNPSRFLKELDLSYVNVVGNEVFNFSSSQSNYNSSPTQSKSIGKTSWSNSSEKYKESQKYSDLTKSKTPLKTFNDKDDNLFDPQNSQLENYKVGTKVKHTRFGLGEVLAIDAENKQLEVHFDNVGVKKLLLRFAKLEII